MTLGHQGQQLTFAGQAMLQLQAAEFDLARLPGHRQVVDKPLVQRPVILKLQGAQAVRDLFDRIRLPMGKVIGRINIPGVTGARVMRAANSIQRWVAHIDIRVRHVDLGPQDVLALGKVPSPHAGKQIQRLLSRAVSERTVLTRLL